MSEELVNRFQKVQQTLSAKQARLDIVQERVETLKKEIKADLESVGVSKIRELEEKIAERTKVAEEKILHAEKLLGDPVETKTDEDFE